MFDPENPGEYAPVCSICSVVLGVFKKILGKNEGAIFFSHNTLPGNKLAKFIRIIMNESKVKKMYVLETPSIKIAQGERDFGSKLRQETVKLFEFVDKVEKDEFEYLIIYEIRKDWPH
nr:hypothetical protein [Candidatus Sigynarchaeota archaeon]